MEIKDSNFEKIKTSTEEYYKAVDSVFCPYWMKQSLLMQKALNISNLKLKEEQDHVKTNSWDLNIYVLLKEY